MIGQAPGADGIPGRYTHLNSGLELYDLVTDVQETQDLSEYHPEVVEQLSVLADSMREVLGDRLHNVEGTQIRQAGQIQPH